ncbi:MAG: hypothetical protein DMG25_01910 [Acidobacteria bacterium]|nr:MAG: hypothetical protein DMG25_01910 [Acidobacteriota bacterium]PYV25896.1 MAG: hypothetical protein DMG27_08430 [Acidobacteriota bacterium]
MELYKSAYQIQSLYGGRNLFQYLFVGDNIALADTGIAETPEKTIFPYMDRLKIRPEQLTLAVTTHADLDHQGGNDAIKRFAPRAWLACGEADRALVEDPRALYDRRYNFLKEEHDVGFDPEPSPDAGKPRKMDVCFTGGERIRLRDDWELEVLHVPGHSQGHLAFYDRQHRAAFVGDAIHGRGCPKAAGGMAIPVTYYRVDIYLSTLRYFESLAIDVLYSGHWPVMRGEQVRDFLAESRQTVELFDRVILAGLEKNPAGLTMKELIDAVATAVGDWPPESWTLAMFSVKGHMDRLEARDKVRSVRGSRPVKWVRA